MATLVLGGTGATGLLVVQQLLKKEQPVKLIVRSTMKLPLKVISSELVEITQANIAELSERELIEQVQGCSHVISCLGHNLSIKGMFGKPRRLVTQVMERVCQAIAKSNPANPVKLILMSTTGFQDKMNGEKVSIAHRAVVAFIRLTLPPHADNEHAAKYLQSLPASQSQHIQWVGIRPDSLVNQTESSHYDLHPTPVCDPIFDARKTSRINVARFMVELSSNPILWQHWQSRFPVIYNRSDVADSLEHGIT
ncbi:NAD(P)-dependent oxidoreductase [Vibrio amylolyticus]|uniref:NAD(P)-dependent oxidoreductase n=1 Tax=Vibrio amylolyticus TaxID=2847292 RepID=UPI00354F3B7A